MTDLLTPDEVREIAKYLIGESSLARLCRNYITLWDRNKELEALIPKRLIQRVGGTDTR